ncbi:MAG: hypothetical protein MJZ36_10230 [Bacteroidaceae bacterium]|nr:hypothetical protein [Bacteroidaceae bacterium]
MSNKAIPGSAIFLEDGTHIFTPYATGNPDKQIWAGITSVELGKMEVSKNKIRVVLTMDRTTLDDAQSKFTNAFAKLIAQTATPKVQRLYEKIVKAYEE